MTLRGLFCLSPLLFALLFVFAFLRLEPFDLALLVLHLVLGFLFLFVLVPLLEELLLCLFVPFLIPGLALRSQSLRSRFLSRPFCSFGPLFLLLCVIAHFLFLLLHLLLLCFTLVKIGDNFTGELVRGTSLHASRCLGIRHRIGGDAGKNACHAARIRVNTRLR